MDETRIHRILGKMDADQLDRIGRWAWDRARKKRHMLYYPKKKKVLLSNQDLIWTAEAKKIAAEMGVAKNKTAKIKVKVGRLWSYLGRCNIRTCFIRLRANRTEQETRRTLIHEVGHLLHRRTEKQFHNRRFKEAVEAQITKENVTAGMRMFGGD